MYTSILLKKTVLMSESKQDKQLPFAYDPNSVAIHPLSQCPNIKDNFTSSSSRKDVASPMCTMKNNYLFYKPVLEKMKKVEQALSYVVRGNLISLIDLIKEDPSLVFEPYPKITAPRGQTYYNVSAFLLMTFLCDADMKKQIMALIPEHFNALRQAQYAEIDCGGADIIKLDRNPMEIMKEQGFEGLLHYKTTFNLFDGTQPKITLPLLQNPNGIICYQDEKGKKHFFYVNKEDQSVSPWEKFTITEKTNAAFKQFKKSFEHMEPNSGRRSSEEEHQLIATVLAISLVRKGIFYTDKKGILYRDSCTPFNLANAYRKCIRLYEEADHNHHWEQADQSWRKDVGASQGEEIWLLQRLCEEDKPFYPLTPKIFANFKRRKCMIYDYGPNNIESVFDGNVINISDVAIYKAGGQRAGGARAVRPGRVGGVGIADFIAICWLIEDALANVIDFKPEQDVRLGCAIRL